MFLPWLNISLTNLICREGAHKHYCAELCEKMCNWWNSEHGHICLVAVGIRSLCCCSQCFWFYCDAVHWLHWTPCFPRCFFCFHSLQPAVSSQFYVGRAVFEEFYKLYICKQPSVTFIVGQTRFDHKIGFTKRDLMIWPLTADDFFFSQLLPLEVATADHQSSLSTFLCHTTLLYVLHHVCDHSPWVSSSAAVCKAHPLHASTHTLHIPPLHMLSSGRHHHYHLKISLSTYTYTCDTWSAVSGVPSLHLLSPLDGPSDWAPVETNTEPRTKGRTSVMRTMSNSNHCLFRRKCKLKVWMWYPCYTSPEAKGLGWMFVSVLADGEIFLRCCTGWHEALWKSITE